MLVVCCSCQKKIDLRIDDRVVRMKFTRDRRDMGLIKGEI
jgi:hypothetical protein